MDVSKWTAKGRKETLLQEEKDKTMAWEGGASEGGCACERW